MQIKRKRSSYSSTSNDDSISSSTSAKPNLDWIRPTGADKNSVSIIQSLQQELNQLQQQENESLDSLQDVFERKKAKVAKKEHEVKRVQTKLLSAQAELKAYQSKLSKAVAFLGNQHEQLGKSLTKLGGFMRQLAHVALAPPQELERRACAWRRRIAQRQRVALLGASHRRGRDAEVLLLGRAVP